MTVVAPPEMEFLTDAVAHWAAVRPDAEALTYREVQWTWEQWHDRMPLFHVGGTSYALFGIYAGAASTFTREPDPASLLAAFAAGARRSPGRAGSAAATSGTSATAGSCSSPTGSRT